MKLVSIVSMQVVYIPVEVVQGCFGLASPYWLVWLNLKNCKRIWNIVAVGKIKRLLKKLGVCVYWKMIQNIVQTTSNCNWVDHPDL